MERLTIRGNDGKAYIRALDPDCTCNQNCPRLWDHFWMLVDRLAAYEDTWLELEGIKEFAEDVAYQFGYYFPIKDMLYISTGGLSTLERAFDILGWSDPHPVPECECEAPGCHELANCGTPTKDGYKRVCGKHFAELTRKEAEAVMEGGDTK